MFVAGCSIISKPLRKDAEFTWGHQQQSALNVLKAVLSSKPSMVIYSIDAKHELHTDASSIGLASVLLHAGNEQLHPISYFSPSTTNKKGFYSYELEALAVVESLERFKYYVYGKKIKVITDFNALRIKNSRIRRMVHVVALSRASYEKAHEVDIAGLKFFKIIIEKAD